MRSELAYYKTLLNDPEMPPVARWLICLALAYLLNPFDLVPDFIPILGFLDDLLIVGGLLLVARTLMPRGLLDRKLRLRYSKAVTNSVGDNK